MNRSSTSSEGRRDAIDFSMSFSHSKSGRVAVSVELERLNNAAKAGQSPLNNVVCRMRRLGLCLDCREKVTDEPRQARALGVVEE